jgi:hypothetical protein
MSRASKRDIPCVTWEMLRDHVAGCIGVLLCCRPVGCYSEASVSSSYTIRVAKGPLHDDRPCNDVEPLCKEQNRSLKVTRSTYSTRI